MLKWLSFLLLASGTRLIEYRFGVNYGEIFHDFSGNSLHAVNGKSSETSESNTIATDRGAYFLGGDTQITLSSNNYVPSFFILGNTFTMAAWVNLKIQMGIYFLGTTGSLIFS